MTVPLGPHPPSASSPKPDSFDIRAKAADILGKIVSLYGPKYPGLTPREYSLRILVYTLSTTEITGLLHTLTQALESSPFPSPLGATNPPAGRYEGAVLAISALGPAAVRQAIWQGGTGLERIDNLAGVLYLGEGNKRRNGLIRASLVCPPRTNSACFSLAHSSARSGADVPQKALSALTRRKVDIPAGPSPSHDQMSQGLGHHFATALTGKKAWLGAELLRLKKEESQPGGADIGNGMETRHGRGQGRGRGNGMEVD